MNTLDYMGIQRWKRRNLNQVDAISPTHIEADSVVDCGVDSQVDSGNVSQVENTTLVDSLPVQNSHPESINQETNLPVEAIPVSRVPQTDEGDDTIEAASDTGSLADSGWQELADRVIGGSHCESCAKTNPVLGDGNLEAKWVFVFDAPSAKDVSHQQLLSGRMGQLFDAILDAIELDRKSIYLTSIFKCPPSQELELAAQCGDLIHRQLELIDPEVVVTLGEFASQTVLRANEDLAQLRSQELRSISVRTNSGTRRQAKVAATYSLSQMLESPVLKASVWQDLKKCLVLS